jgi:hypothetical protein
MSEADPEPAPADAEAETEDSPVAAGPAPGLMDRREQLLGWILAGAVAIAVVTSWTPDVVHGNGRAVSGAIGLGLTAILAAAVWFGRRLITAFAAMATGVAPVSPASTSAIKTSFGTLSLLSLLFGGFLLFRNTLAQRKLAMARPRRPRSTRTRTRTRASKAGADASVAANGVRRPSANRRYTPPKSKTPRRGR